MATRSLIATKKGVTYKSIYCHWDGYPENQYPLLKNYYSDPEKIDKLIELGALSYLGKEIGEKQPFDKPNEDWCLSYGRDRGEEDFQAKENLSMKEVFQEAYGCGAEFLYVHEDNEWKIFHVSNGERILPESLNEKS
jgi:hypothetical protein